MHRDLTEGGFRTCRASPGGLFSLAKAGYLNELFVSAGFRETITTTVPAVFSLPSAKAYLDFSRSSASPIIRLPSTLSEPAWKEMEERLEIFQTPTGWKGPNELLLTSGSS